MTYCSTYIGDLDCPGFEWEGGDWNGNIPGRVGPLFPPAVGHYHQKFHAWVNESGVVCKQTDFGGWVARVTRQQLLDFISYCYGPSKTDAIERLIDFIGSLDDSKEYGLVAEEF